MACLLQFKVALLSAFVSISSLNSVYCNNGRKVSVIFSDLKQNSPLGAGLPEAVSFSLEHQKAKKQVCFCHQVGDAMDNE